MMDRMEQFIKQFIHERLLMTPAGGELVVPTTPTNWLGIAPPANDPTTAYIAPPASVPTTPYVAPASSSVPSTPSPRPNKSVAKVEPSPWSARWKGKGKAQVEPVVDEDVIFVCQTPPPPAAPLAAQASASTSAVPVKQSLKRKASEASDILSKEKDVTKRRRTRNTETKPASDTLTLDKKGLELLIEKMWPHLKELESKGKSGKGKQNGTGDALLDYIDVEDERMDTAIAFALQLRRSDIPAEETARTSKLKCSTILQYRKSIPASAEQIILSKRRYYVCSELFTEQQCHYFVHSYGYHLSGGNRTISHDVLNAHNRVCSGSVHFVSVLGAAKLGGSSDLDI